MGYQQEYQQSINQPESFWSQKAAALQWFQKPDHILSQDANGFYRWFKGGKLNTAYLALDYHVENGRAGQTALIYDSAATNTLQKFTYRELRDQVARFAGALKAHGLEKGDRIIIYMPMVPEAIIAMLASARLGAVHSVVFGGFAPHELAIRIDDARPKIIATASCGLEFNRVIEYKPLLDKGIDLADHKPDCCIVLQRPQAEANLQAGRDISWDEAMRDARPADYVPVDATDPLYILYTSGTTGKPKGIVRDNGGHAVALNYSMSAIYGVDAGDVFWAASDVGWVVGHSYIVYGPLIKGCTTICFEGKPVRNPDAGTFWRVMAQHRVKVFFTAPTAFRAIRKEDPEGKFAAQYDLSQLKHIFLAGERLDPPTWQWLNDLLEIPILDHWWQTESGWPMVGNMMGIEPLPVKPGSATVPIPGYNVQILDAGGKPCAANREGAVVIKLPLPPSCLPTLWNDDQRFKTSYLAAYPGYYLSGDGGYMDEDGYVFIMGRTDDVINVAGHRLSTGEMEELLASHEAVAECAVFGVADAMKGHVPVGLVILKDDAQISEEELQNELVQLIRSRIGAIACFKQVAIVKRLPKTRSGKILRNVMRQIADGQQYTIPSTIDDPQILQEIAQRMKEREMGIAHQSGH